MENDVFTEATPSESFLDKYVGEGKKFKDVEALAKAYEHADNHIPKLTEDLQTTREFIASKLEELAKRSEAQPIVQTDETRGNQPAPVAPPNDAGEDLDTRIAKILEERDEVKVFQSNGKLAQDVLVEHLGSVEAAVEAVRAKAAEMGVGPEFLRETAHRSPRAFFNLMGINPDQKPQSSATPSSSSDVNPRMLEAGKPKPNSYAYYDQLRKSDPKLYWSPKVQASLMKDAQENPDFFKR